MTDVNPDSEVGSSPDRESLLPIDASMKAHLRTFPGALFRLAGHPIDPGRNGGTVSTAVG